MGTSRRKRNFNLGNVIAGSALVALGISFWIPYGTADRTARVEQRAGDVAALLLEEASRCQPLDLGDPGLSDLIGGRVAKAVRARGIPDDAFVDPDAGVGGLGWPALLFRGEHYSYQVTLTPAEYLSGDAAPEVEVYAWPNTPLGPGHTVFFFSQTGSPAYSRNLYQAYEGVSKPPRAGCAQPRPHDPRNSPDWYRGRDDERWIRF